MLPVQKSPDRDGQQMSIKSDLRKLLKEAANKCPFHATPSPNECGKPERCLGCCGYCVEAERCGSMCLVIRKVLVAEA